MPAVKDHAPPAASYASRTDVPEAYRWNLSDIFLSDSIFEDEFQRVEKSIADVAALRGTLEKDAATLYDALESREQLHAWVDRLLLYAGLTYHEDMSDTRTQGRWDRAHRLATQAAEATSWFVPELLALDESAVHTWMQRDEKLAVYRHAYDDLRRQRKHVLSSREEELLAMAGEVCSAPENIYSRFTNTNLDFPMIRDEHGTEVRLSAARYTTFIYSSDRRVRREAFAGMHSLYAAKANTLSAMLSAHVKQHIFHARARGYPDCLAAALDGPNVPIAVYDNLIASIRKHRDKLHRYVALRKKLLGLDEIHAYDLYVPLIDAPKEKIPYEQAMHTIMDALALLGDDYVDILRRALTDRWIDVYETPNKRSGAYCWGSYLTHPYLLLNYNGTMNDRSTIAHELGHAMHSWYTVRHQPMAYGRYETFCAEVASTVNEVLLADYLYQHATNDTQRLLILQQQIDEIRTTVFRQTLFAEYERLIHRQAEAGLPLTADVLCRWYADLVHDYYGPELAMDEVAPAEGLRIPHFYRNFYVYTYATSHCAATDIGRRILDGVPGAVEGLKAFLSAGSSRFPLDILKLASVDMTTPAPIERTMLLFDELVTRFEALHGGR